MSMRISNLMTQRATVRDLQDDLSKVQETMRRASSGRSINQPSDNPYGASLALQLNGELDGLAQYQSNVSDGTAWLNASQAALTSINDVVQRARELVVGAANDAGGQAGRSAAAAEIDQLVASLKQEANVKYAGRYVFSGTATDTEPYPAGSVDRFGGDSGTISREIGPNVSLPVNADVSSLLGNGQSAADNRLLDTLRDISDDLRGGTSANADNLRGTDLQRLDANLDQLNGIVADVGARTNRLTAASSRLMSLQQNTTGLLSQTQDADYAQTLTDYSTQSAAYNAALQMGARIIQNSLLDFLH
ncbi:MAG: flagellar hook-associated protein 3 [Conexibacter sp.]|nr:flagellar hook-associated protein 3 [Conexibacter sp.]